MLAGGNYARAGASRDAERPQRGHAFGGAELQPSIVSHGKRRASIRWHTPASGAPCSKHPAGGHIGASGREVNRRPAVIGRSAARRLKRSAASWTASRGTCWHTRPTDNFLTSQSQPLEARPDRSGGHPSETAGEGFPLNFQPRRGKEIETALTRRPSTRFGALLPHQRTLGPCPHRHGQL